MYRGGLRRKIWSEKENGMAEPNRHAAWHPPRSYSVKLLDQDIPLELARGLTDFLDAFEFAAEWLDREDPTRQGTTRLAIFETRGDVMTEVWTYPAAPPNDQLVKLFGFDPVRWKPAPEGTSRYYGGRTGRRDRS